MARKTLHALIAESAEARREESAKRAKRLAGGLQYSAEFDERIDESPDERIT